MPTSVVPTLNSSLQYLKGVGPERHKLLKKIGLETIGDALNYFPRRYEDRRLVREVSEADAGDRECVRGTVMSRSVARMKDGRSLVRAVVSDGKEVLFVSWFNQPYLLKMLEPKTPVILCGRLERQGGRKVMVHPEHEFLKTEEPPIHSGRIVPVYPLTEDVSQKGLRQLLYRLSRQAAGLAVDALPRPLRSREGLEPLSRALAQIHFPDDDEALERARNRLAFDEFFSMQLALQLRRRRLRKQDERVVHSGGRQAVERFLETLEFELTDGQRAAVERILADMAADRPMGRLVQGDVGSGKTVVAAAAIVFTAANGFQGALMAPTEVLAQQHYHGLVRLLEPLGVRCVYLTQGLSAEERARRKAELADGTAQVAVGTHALIQSDVRFSRLGLAVIDEQHKFGVLQREALLQRGGFQPHFLLLTATPIPRTLAMTLYGDLDVSVIREMPEGRKPVKTFWVGSSKRADVYSLLESELAAGRQGYVICPLIEEGSGPSALRAAGRVSAELSELLGHRRVGLLHGRMSAPEKKKVMEDFRERKLDVLVSTVVIEVGVNVPNATMMIVENAERFGLAQLHQLRGRVGRGSQEATCVLFSDSESPETAERLGALEETSDGFEVARRDLALRGAGELAGRRQHGMPELKLGDYVRDAALLERARALAEALLEEDPELARAEHRLLRRAIAERYGWKNPARSAALG